MTTALEVVAARLTGEREKFLAAIVEIGGQERERASGHERDALLMSGDTRQQPCDTFYKLENIWLGLACIPSVSGPSQSASYLVLRPTCLSVPAVRNLASRFIAIAEATGARQCALDLIVPHSSFGNAVEASDFPVEVTLGDQALEALVTCDDPSRIQQALHVLRDRL